ncbi:hypothetical protein BDZ89DRAFT_397971 [Hymenopellis radicata]|nr:hypothetical protein BDZ89DRAFT_397971 [Hymenopellis radicata]
MDGLRYAVEHVFMPPKLPQAAGDPTQELARESALARYVSRAANSFPTLEMGTEWMAVVEMLKAVRKLHGDTPYTVDQLRQRFVHMLPGDVTALLIRKQNAGFIMRRNNDNVVFEVFEVSAPSASVVQAEGKLIWTFPASAAEVPIATFQQSEFQKKLASFLAHMNQDELDLLAREARNIAVHPRHISVLLMTILTATGGEDSAIISPIRRVTKRIADEALSADKASGIWRRSPLYLLIRVAIQTTLAEPIEYKAFMIYFMASLLKEANKPSVNLPSGTLSHMCSKITRRAAKLGDELPQAVIDEASFTCEAVREVIQIRWEAIQAKESAPPVGWSTFGLDIYDDCTLQLLNSSAYITNVIHDHTSYVFTSSYVPKHTRRLCDYPFNDVLQQNFKTFVEETDASLVLADFEAAVRDNLGDWVAMNLAEPAAPGLLEGKIKQYMALASEQYQNNAENQSLMILVVLELWVALDEIVIKRIPLLASYSPEVSVKLLEPLLFRRAGELARVRDVALYIRRRTSDAEAGNRPSIFAALAPWSFCAQYYATSQVMKDGKTLIERKAKNKRDEKIQELREKTVEYNAWVAKCNRTEHDEDCYRYRKRKRNHCARCSLIVSSRP